MADPVEKKIPIMKVVSSCRDGMMCRSRGTFLCPISVQPELDATLESRMPSRLLSRTRSLSSYNLRWIFFLFISVQNMTQAIEEGGTAIAPSMGCGRAAKVGRPYMEVSRAIKPPPTMAGSRAHKVSGDGGGGVGDVGGMDAPDQISQISVAGKES
jgi:hypothetical protein